VRVPLHGRRVRGWTLARDVPPGTDVARLHDVLAVASAGPPADVVALTEHAAWRWAGPRATFLRAASAPNLVEPGPAELHVAVFPESEAPVPVPRGRVRAVVWPPALRRAELVRSLAESTGSTLVVAPNPREASALTRVFARDGRVVHELRSDRSDAERTRAWRESRSGACIVVGGRLAVWAPVPDLTGIVLLDDSDEALAEERAPAWHAREVAAERARRSEARLSLVAPWLSVEAAALVGEEHTVAPPSLARRGWPMIEAVDLREEPPGTGLLARSLGPRMQRVLDRGGRAVLVLNRKGRARLLVCQSCGGVAACERCGARLVEGDGAMVCARCDQREPVQCQACGSTRFRRLRPGVTGLRDAVAALVPRRRVVAVDAASAPIPAFDVAIGTEAVLHRVEPDPTRPIGLVVFLDFDQELFAPRYRAVEQALWLLVRAARLVGPADTGGALVVQTRAPDHEVVRAARDADPMPLTASEERRRRELRFPPFGGLAELRGDEAAVGAACDALRGAVEVVGPSGGQALLRAASVGELCDALAATDLGPARALGRLRIDVDPLRV